MLTYPSSSCQNIAKVCNLERRMLCFAATHICLQLLSPNILQAQPEFKLETGWTWVLKPQPCDPGQRTWLILEQVKPAKCEWSRLGEFSACVVPQNEGHEYQVALFKQDGARLEACQASAGTTQANVSLFSFDQTVSFAGVAVLSPDGMEKSSRVAIESARTAKLSIMPFIGVPELRASWPKNYQFSLTLANGKQFDSTSMKGKVIVVDCWATWCGPCMQFLPVLRETGSKHRDKTEVVSICYDNPADAGARKAIDKYQITEHAHLLFAPRKKSDYALWETSMTGSESAALPRIFMILPTGELLHTSPQEFQVDFGRAIRLSESRQSDN